MDTYFVNVTEKGSQGKPVEMERDGGRFSAVAYNQ